MRRREFIDLILNSISDRFDIYHNYRFMDKKFVIYGYHYNQNNKFDSSDESSKLWEAKSYEHLFFINYDNLDMNTLKELKDFAVNCIEPHFIRGDGKSPVKHHLCSHISFIIITRNKPSEDVIRAIEGISWTKSYAFSTKGYSDLRMVVVTPREYSVISSDNADDLKDFLMELLLHVDHYEED